MPANLTPAYRKAEKEFRAARTAAEKIVCLEAMLRLIPKHKGTDHMQADLKRRLSRLRKERESGQGKKKAAAVVKVEKEGAGQVVLLGPPNAGKSQLLGAVTRAHATGTEYPFATHVPMPGMMVFEDVQIQLVDTPPITEDYMEVWATDTVRRGDAALLMADMGSDDCADGIATILHRLDQVKVRLVRDLPPDAPQEVHQYRRAAILANKMDRPGADDRLEVLREFFGDRYDIWPISATTGAGLDDLRRNVFGMLRIMRIYTKEPGKPADMQQPYTVPIGSALIELAAKVHREFEDTLKSARVWGSGKYDGIHVKRDHVLQDRDIVELRE